MAECWLLREREVLASVEVADSFLARGRGLLGLDGFDGAMLLPHTKAVHTLGMRFAIDVAFLDKNLVVVDVVQMGTWRIGLPRLRARSVLEAEAGAFERWNLQSGDRLELKGSG
ncbi:MAG: DUF192 domain-containing protein [Acidimicrobiales bacterium]|jgi:hypothetical protein